MKGFTYITGIQKKGEYTIKPLSGNVSVKFKVWVETVVENEERVYHCVIDSNNSNLEFVDRDNVNYQGTCETVKEYLELLEELCYERQLYVWDYETGKRVIEVV